MSDQARDTQDSLTAGGLVEGLEHERSRGGNDFNARVAVLDDELDGDLQASPLLGVGLDHIRGLLGRHSQRTQLGGEDGHVGGLTSNASAVELGELGTQTAGRGREGAHVSACGWVASASVWGQCRGREGLEEREKNPEQELTASVRPLRLRLAWAACCSKRSG